MKSTFTIIITVTTLLIMPLNQPAFSQETDGFIEQVIEEPLMPVFEEKSESSSDEKKIKLLHKIGAIERAIDKNKSKLEKLRLSIEKNITKIQNKVTRHESTLSLATKESKQKKLRLKIEKVKKIILKHELKLSRAQEKTRKIIEKMELKISELGPY